MKTIQQIFDTVIDNGLYEDSMCPSLGKAKNRLLITEEEYQKADKAIYNYMKKLNKYVDYRFTPLRDVLWQKGLPFSYEDRLKIYRDWKNRPTGTPKNYKKLFNVWRRTVSKILRKNEND